MIRALTILAIGLAAAPAFADAITYQGKIGDLDVVVEFSEQPLENSTELFGRYFYVEKGVDIPLHWSPAGRASIGLAEEVACDAATNNCPHAQDDPPGDPPLGARWELDFTRDHTGLEGKWINNGRSQPVWLTSVGRRDFDAGGNILSMTDFATGLFYQGTTLTPDTSPYDHLKVSSVPLTVSDPVELDRARYQYVADPRTKFQFPRIIDIGGADDAPANAFLEQRHWMMSLDALYCASQRYQGFGWNGYNSDAGTLGWWDEEQVEVRYLTPTVMSWTEAGSLSCGGAHPYNHYEWHNLDVAAGKPLDLSLIFSGWVAKDYTGATVDLETARANPRDYQWLPDEKLAAWVKANRKTDAELGFDSSNDEDGGCPIDELIDTNLAIGFTGDGDVLFTLSGLPHVIQACSSDLVQKPITALGDLLAPTAADYFPELAG